MKILFLVHKYQARGQEIFAVQLGNQLIKQGHEVQLISLYSGNFPLSFISRKKSLGLTRGIDLWKFKNWKKLQEFVFDFQPDIIQANGGDTLKFLALASLFFDFHAKLIFNNGGVISYYLRNHFQKKLYAIFLGQMDGLVSVSQFSDSDLVNTFSLRVPHQVIRIGIEFPEVNRSPQQVISWIHIGGFTPEKNHARLIQIFKQAKTSGIQGSLTLIGEGELKLEIVSLVKEMKLEKEIIFLGAVSEPWQFANEKSVLLLPSKIEGMPAVIAESLVLGIPVIAYRVGGIGEMEEEFPSILGINVDNENAFIEGMISVQNHFTYWRNLGEWHREKAKNFFDINEVANEYLAFYHRL